MDNNRDSEKDTPKDTLKDSADSTTSSTAPTSVSSEKQGTSRSRESTSNNASNPSSSSGGGRGRPRTRSDLSNPLSAVSLEKRGYHTITCLGKDFHVDKRWKLVRELGQGAYGIVILAQDTISGENVAIKLVTRIFDKKELAKRALREIALLRHFNHHENITGLIDMDLLSPDFNEIYLFMEPMEADLHQIIRSGQTLTNAHVQYFLYQILRGCKFIHSADVVHRDLKPGNLLVNADCELKICDLGLSRGYERSTVPDEESVTHMTEYVATRWYRAPEIMLSFRRYGPAIDVWSIGCILGELLGGKPIFKGKDYVDQLNLILKTLGTPDEKTIKKIGSEKAQAYIRSLPFKKKVAFDTMFPGADPQAIDLLTKMLEFDPSDRITVLEALQHPYLESYHEIGDEPECPTLFDKWRDIEAIESDFEYRKAIWREVYEFRLDVRSAGVDDEEQAEDEADQLAEQVQEQLTTGTEELTARVDHSDSALLTDDDQPDEHTAHVRSESAKIPFPVAEDVEPATLEEIAEARDKMPANAVLPRTSMDPVPFPSKDQVQPEGEGDFSKPIPRPHMRATSSSTLRPRSSSGGTVDPYTTYARRSSLLFTPAQPNANLPGQTQSPGVISAESSQMSARTGSGFYFAGSGGQGSAGYVVPMRSRVPSTDGGTLGQPLLRTLSTGGLAALTERKMITQADLPASAMPKEFEGEQPSVKTATAHTPATVVALN